MTAQPGGEPPRAEALELHLGRDPRAPAQARSAMSAWCEPLAVSRARTQALVLLVSELVSNAVLHAKAPDDTPITLSARLAQDNVHVSVSDAGEGFVPRPRDPALLSDGYGLFLLEKIASRWGVDSVGPTSVWFELPRTGG